MTKLFGGEPMGQFGALRFCLIGVFASSLSLWAEIPLPEKLLPDDTLLVLSAPDFAKLRQFYKTSPQNQLWNDPELKSFKESFLDKWKKEVIEPLERELDVRLADYFSLPQGQVTFALIQNGWQGRENESIGKVLLVDTREKRGELQNNLSAFRRKWIESGRNLRIEKIRDIDFLVVSLSSNDIPQVVRKFLPQKPEVQELGPDNELVKKPVSKSELIIGQADSLLIIANSIRVAEKIVARVGGGNLPALADLAAFQGNKERLFRDAPLYGWINLKTYLVILNHAPETKDSDAAPDPFGGIRMEKVLAAAGFSGLRTFAFTGRNSNDGLRLQFFIGAPESTRAGLFKVIAGEPKESGVPPFVPADVIKFRRWRLDGQKAWNALEKTLNDISPNEGNTIKTLFDMANSAAKERDPGFDVRKNLIGNLGDDIVMYKKAPRGTSPEEIKAAPWLVLLASPNPVQFTAALRSIFGMTGAPSGPASEREFLGRKIFWAPMPAVPLFGAGSPPGSRARTVQYAATSAYVALSSDASLLEEFLRGNEGNARSLRESPGLLEAAQAVIGPGTGLFGFENEAETMRATLDGLRKNPESAATNSTLNVLPAFLAMGNAEKSVRDLMDFSLLPPFERISKYFSFSVYGASATSDGLTFKVFKPTPLAGKAAGNH